MKNVPSSSLDIYYFFLAVNVDISNAEQLLHAHVGGPENCTTGHIKLMKVRA
jgi:hypothetical protein